MSHKDNSAIQLVKNLDRIGDNNKPFLVSGEVKPIELFEGKPVEYEYILTLVAVLAAQKVNIIPQITAIQDKLRTIDPTHYYYPPISLHVTIIGCTPFYPERKAIHEEHINKIIQICSKTLQAWDKPLRLHIKGLKAIPYSVFLQAFNHDGMFRQIRQQIFNALKTSGEEPIERLDSGEIHINIMKFAHTDHVKLEQIASEIQYLQEVEIGILTIDNLELDITDRNQSPHKTSIIRTFNLDKIVK